MGFLKGSDETTTVDPAPMSAQEIELLEKEIQLANEQLESIGSQQDFQSFLFDNFSTFLEEGDSSIADTQFQQALEALGLSSDAIKREAELAAGGATIDPQTEAFIDEIFENQLAVGESAVDSQVRDALELVKQELAPARGLRFSDTPITDRGFKIAGEGVSAKGDLLSTLAANAAASKLNFPLQQGALTSQRNQFLANFGNTSAGFANLLQQQAFNNRLNLINTTGGLGIGLATGIGANPGEIAFGLQQGRIDSAPTTVSSSGGTDIQGIGQLLSGTGSLITALKLSGAAAGCWVAREVYGADNPKWLLFREWMFTKAPKWLLRLYLRYGEHISEIIRPMPRVKSIIRYFMDKAIDGRT